MCRILPLRTYIYFVFAACIALRFFVAYSFVETGGVFHFRSKAHFSSIFSISTLNLRNFAFAGALGKSCDASSLRTEPALAVGGPDDIVFTNRSDAIRASLSRSTPIDSNGRGFAVLIAVDANYFAYVAVYALVLQSELPLANLLVYLDETVPGSFLQEFSKIVGIAHERVIFTRMTNRDKVPPRFNNSATMGFLRFLIDDPLLLNFAVVLITDADYIFFSSHLGCPDYWAREMVARGSPFIANTRAKPGLVPSQDACPRSVFNKQWLVAATVVVQPAQYFAEAGLIMRKYQCAASQDLFSDWCCATSDFCDERALYLIAAEAGFRVSRAVESEWTHRCFPLETGLFLHLRAEPHKEHKNLQRLCALTIKYPGAFAPNVTRNQTRYFDWWLKLC